MRTWLFTWNKERWAWDGIFDGYKELKSDIEQVGHAYLKWSCGVNKSIQPGDRIFLIKLGEMPKGIVASGYAKSFVLEGAHWDSEKRKAGRKARRVYVDFDTILDYETDEILPFDELKEISADYKWSAQASGVSIPDDIAEKIEEAWKQCK